MQSLEKDDDSGVSVPAYQFLYLATAETSRNGHFITLVPDCLFYVSRQIGFVHPEEECCQKGQKLNSLI